jgi:hypothetical protein
VALHFVGFVLPILLVLSGCRRPTSTFETTVTVTLTPSSIDLPPGVSTGEFESALQAAAAAWGYPEVPCTSLRVLVTKAQRTRLVTEDSVNAVIFRSQRWCHNERCGRDSTFPIRAAAMTTVFPRGAGPGLVREGDIELNGVHFDWQDGAGMKPQAPLQAVLVHEIGHVLGLRDECSGPDCRHDPETAMANVGRTAPGPDDVRRVCTAFPRDR